MTIFISFQKPISKWVNSKLKLKPYHVLPYHTAASDNHIHVSLPSIDNLEVALSFISGHFWDGPYRSYLFIYQDLSNQYPMSQISFFQNATYSFFPKARISNKCPLTAVTTSNEHIDLIYTFIQTALKFTNSDLIQTLHINPSKRIENQFASYVDHIQKDEQLVALQSKEHPLYKTLVSTYHLSATHSSQLKNILQNLSTLSMTITIESISSQSIQSGSELISFLYNLLSTKQNHV